MFGKTVLILTFAIMGCADKNYADENSNPQSVLGKADAVCPLSFPQSGLCAHFNWEKYPSEAETGSIILRFWEAGDPQAFPALKNPTMTVKVLLWMPSMGHGSSPVRLENIAPGVYRADRVFFSMRGDWEIRFQLKQGNEVVEQTFYPLIF